MNPLFYVALALSLSAIAVTVYAVVKAPEGFEDEQGFHTRERSPADRPTTHAEDGGDAAVRTFYSAR